MAHDADFRRELGQQLRVDSVRASAAAGSGHPTSSMSAADLMAVLIDGHLRLDYHNPHNPANDHLIFSKGHASPLYYSVLKAVGAIDDDELLTFRKLGSRLEGHPTPRIPPTDVATGSLGQGLPISVGVAHRRRAARPAPVPRVVPVRRLGDGRGLDVGGLPARRLGGPRQPRGDHRRQPARPDPRDDARLGRRRLRPAHRGVRLERDRHRRPRRRGDRGRLRRGRGHQGQADRDHRPHEEGQGRQGGRGPARQARQAAGRSRGGDPGAGRRARPVASTWPSRDAGEPHRVRDLRRRAAHLGARRRGGHAQGLRARADRAGRDPRRRRRARRRGVQLDALGGLPQGAPGPLLRDVHRRAAADRRGRRACRWAAAGCRSPRRSPRSSRAPTTSCAWRRSRGRTSGSSARTPACRSARTARRRWRWRTSRPSARSTAPPSCIRRDANQTAQLVAAMADQKGISFLRTLRGKTPVRTPAGRGRDGSAAAADRPRGRRRGHRRLRHHARRGRQGRRAAGRRGRQRPRDRLLLDQADRRARPSAPRRASAARSSPSRTTGPRAGWATPCSRRWPRATSTPTWSSWPCARCRAPARRTSCCTRPGIDADGDRRRGEEAGRARPP